MLWGRENVSDVYVSVTEAAQILGVHPQRIQQRIREGSLPAVKVGHQWAIERNELHRFRYPPRPGRPLSTKSAWDLLAVVSGAEAAARLSPSARSRARSRLRSLLAHASSADLEDAAGRIAHTLRNRAERALFVASPRDLPDIREDDRVHLSGVSTPDSNLSAGVVAEGYVYAHDRNALVDDYLLAPASRSRANVILHVVPSDNADRAAIALHTAATSPLALAADLAEYDGIRERAEAVRLAVGLHAKLGALGAHFVGPHDA